MHWPFCKSKCPYCDFNSHVGNSIDTDDFINSYISEIKYFRSILGECKNIKTVFFGGGTPSLAPPEFFHKVLKALNDNFNLDPSCEITMEANPTSVESSKFVDFKHAGINRVSVGIQSFDDKNLKFLGREHDSKSAKKAIELAANTFDRFSFDLIYTLPNQTQNDWENELNQAFEFNPEHLSLYQLTIEKGTKFYSMHRQNKFQMPEDEKSADMFEFTNEFMVSKGLPPYEISNYAQLGKECQHNIVYWKYDDFIGIGPGAHGRYKSEDQRFGTMMIHSPKNWHTEVKNSGLGIQQQVEISNKQAFEEMIIMGLRMYRPLEIHDIEKLNNLDNLHNLGLLNINGNKIMPTQKGRLLLNKIISEIL